MSLALLAELLWHKLSLLPTDPGEASAFAIYKNLCDQSCVLNCETNQMLSTRAPTPSFSFQIVLLSYVFTIMPHIYVFVLDTVYLCSYSVQGMVI